MILDVGSRLIVGFALSLAIGGLAYWRRSLSASGVLGAVLVGTTIFGFGGWVRGLLLIAFFISSSLLSHYHDRRKAALAEKFAKGNRRDLGQTLANGGMAALLALAIGLTGVSSGFYAVLALAFYGALATANADTWATELGVLARSQPRLLTTGRPVPVGTSGGVTAAGFAAALGRRNLHRGGRIRARPGGGQGDHRRLVAERLDHRAGGGRQWVSWLSLR